MIVATVLGLAVIAGVVLMSGRESNVEPPPDHDATTSGAPAIGGSDLSDAGFLAAAARICEQAQTREQANAPAPEDATLEERAHAVQGTFLIFK